jgi:predicted O-methyltransferase YrrM
LEQLGGTGSLVSLEHDAHFAELTNSQLREHGLQRIATVRHAPLCEFMLADRTWRWYQRDKFEDLTGIDMVVVDGPPGNTQPLARYPGLPLLFDQLSHDAIILVDDAKRKDERLILDMWMREYPQLKKVLLDTKKGAALLRQST